MIKKIFGVIVILGLAVGSFFGIFYAVRNSKLEKQILSDSEYISTIDSLRKELAQYKNNYAKLNENYLLVVAENNKYEEDIADLNEVIQEKALLIENYQQSLLEKESEISDFESEMADLTSRLSELGDENQELENQISSLDKQLSELRQDYGELQNTYLSVLSEKNNLVIDKESLEIRLSANEEKLKEYDRQFVELQNEITRLSALLESYEDLINQIHTATFYIGDYLYTAKAVRHGETVSDLESPEETDSYIFEYWTLNGNDFVDVASYEITDDVVFYAKFIPKYKVEFLSVGSVIETQYVEKGGFAKPISDPSQDGYQFIGWSVDGSSVVDISNYAITSDTIFTAKFTSVVSQAVFFNMNEDIFSSYLAPLGIIFQSLNWEYCFNGETCFCEAGSCQSPCIFCEDCYGGCDCRFAKNLWESNQELFIYSSVDITSNATIMTPVLTDFVGDDGYEYHFIGWSVYFATPGDSVELFDFDNSSIIETTYFCPVFEKGGYTYE